MTATYLVEIVHKTVVHGGGELTRYKVEAGSGYHAYEMVRAMLGIHPRNVYDIYVTADPYKVDRV